MDPKMHSLLGVKWMEESRLVENFHFGHMAFLLMILMTQMA